MLPGGGALSVLVASTGEHRCATSPSPATCAKLRFLDGCGTSLDGGGSVAAVRSSLALPDAACLLSGRLS